MDTADLLSRLLDVIEHDLVPLSRLRIAAGDKIFGAAILRKADLSLVVADVNNETVNPLLHGEISAINAFYRLPPEGRPGPRDCLFLTTHEPCSLCLSGITWGGFDNFYYLFSYEQTRDAFDIPHDIRILREVFAVPDPGQDAVPAGRDLYNRRNAFFTSHAIIQLIAGLDRGARERLVARVDDLTALYGDLSAIYQAGKGARGIPLA